MAVARSICWSDFAAALSPPKARLARRLICSGEALTLDQFERRGMRLTGAEAVTVASARDLDSNVVERVVEAGSEGVERLVVELADRERVETVLLPGRAVCVSTQVGCAVGCRFCASGLDGLSRNLTPTEIVDQLIWARRRRAVERVVFMGIGEPTHNLAAVLEAAERLAEDALIPGSRQTLSTVGSSSAFARMTAARVRPNLALSIHHVDAEQRRALLPRASHEPVGALVDAALAYGEAIDRPVQFAWTLLAGINDGHAEISGLIDLVRGRRCFVNLIEWNRVPELPFEAPSHDRAMAIMRRLRAEGIVATVRASAGRDLEAACGQLRVSRAGGNDCSRSVD